MDAIVEPAGSRRLPPSHPSSPWNEAADAELRRLYALTDPQLSMAQIADELAHIGCKVTRDAVIGRIHRTGLPLRGRSRPGDHPRRYKPRPRKLHLRIAAESLSVPVVITSQPQGPTLPLEELRRRHCRYPFGDGPFRFCALPVVPGCSWCPAHARMVFRQTPAWVDRSRGARR